ncbi:glutamate racemase [Aquimarina agarivorans]|uniref:glutamate racemase n=1 Tax=Aquimarina agarivorans TaxID=980584 RepID=UPI000248E66C|nr:glutamate racemase [Aquimarina agarivorans]
MKEPIGVFDSGIGGTSILKELVKLLPNENIIYLADSANAPYGQKNPEQIVALCKKNVSFLLKKGCKLIVVACNTATTNAISELRSSYSVPFVGIEPAIKPAALGTKTKAIGILATKGTLSSALFAKASDSYGQNTEIIEVIGKGLVEYIEAGDFDNPNLEILLKKYIQPMIHNHVDYLVLGCSHYPFLVPLLTKILPQNVKIIDSGAAVARQTRVVLKKKCIANTSNKVGEIMFYTNSKANTLAEIVKNHFKNYKIEAIKTYTS